MNDNDAGWYKRRELLRSALRRYDCATTAQLAAVLGWDGYEVAAKLVSLRHDGLADYDESRPKVWRAT